MGCTGVNSTQEVIRKVAERQGGKIDGWLAKVSCPAICLLELMTQRLRERKPLSRPWWLTTEQGLSVRRPETAAILLKMFKAVS